MGVPLYEDLFCSNRFQLWETMRSAFKDGGEELINQHKKYLNGRHGEAQGKKGVYQAADHCNYVLQGTHDEIEDCLKWVDGLVNPGAEEQPPAHEQEQPAHAEEHPVSAVVEKTAEAILDMDNILKKAAQEVIKEKNSGETEGNHGGSAVDEQREIDKNFDLILKKANEIEDEMLSGE